MISAEAEALARAHAADDAPRESAGLVVAGEYRPCENVAGDPLNHFRMPAGDVLDAQREGLDAVIHSHPDPHPPCPSLADMVMQRDFAVPCAIVPVAGGEAAELVWWGPGVAVPPLIGRPYRHGVTDCFSIVRDWYRLEHGIELDDVPRGWRWWTAGEHNPDLYERGFREAGFEEIAPADAGVGDGLLLQVGAPVINHAAVIVADGVILHHPGGSRPYDPMQLSRRDVFGRWQPYVRRVIRPHR